MNENKNNKGRGVFYGVIGVATLVVAIIGATFAYFTAAQNAGNGVIGGNMATIGFNLEVTKVKDPGASTGMIPMSNSMIEPAIVKTGNGTCTDDNGNAVCQIYQITITNTSTASMFVDGYVALTGGSGLPTDTTAFTTNNSSNTMRWAQVFAKTGNDAGYTTAGVQPLAATATEETSSTGGGAININSLDAPKTTTTDTQTSDNTGFNSDNIKTSNVTQTQVLIGGNPYDAVDTNFIRISDHPINIVENGPNTINTDTDFTRSDDETSMLVINQQLGPTGQTGASRTYYFVVWLTETGFNQTPGQSANVTSPSTTTVNNPASENFFNGIVRFISAQGSEVTATFSGYTAVRSDNA